MKNITLVDQDIYNKNLSLLDDLDTVLEALDINSIVELKAKILSNLQDNALASINIPDEDYNHLQSLVTGKAAHRHMCQTHLNAKLTTQFIKTLHKVENESAHRLIAAYKKALSTSKVSMILLSS